MFKTVIIVAVAVCGGVMLMAAILLFVRRTIEARMSEVTHKLEHAEVLAVSGKAGFLGRKPGPLAQIRGNGILVLTRSDLTIYMLKPGVEHRLPLDHVEYIDHPRFFHGKFGGRRTLVVHFRDDIGEKCAMGFWVPGPREWAGRIIEAGDALNPSAKVDKPGEVVG
jgi:hypothetical protein